MQSTTLAKRLSIALAFIHNSAGDILLAQRPSDKSFANCWEFPGGKIEANETPQAAMRRECLEELSLIVHNATLALHFCYAYAQKPHEFWLWSVAMADCEGLVSSAEDQTLAWVQPAELSNYPMPAANQVIIEQLTTGKLSI